MSTENNKISKDNGDNDSTSVISYEANDAKMNHTYNARGSREQRPRQYDKVYGANYIFAVALTQMLTSRGIKRFDQRANDALAVEWKQLDTLSVFKGREY